ncbi:MAG TPA: dTMP kinase [Acidimicrobiales bacterium]|nr:dTMP kinase [Acidimicrobiales bacterium]
MSTGRRGRLIALEGGEGCGKSTQAALLAERLGVLLTREPGGTAIGEQVRALLLDPATAGLAPRAEALLMAAARAQHVAEVIRPALDAGRDVVTDRWVGSSLAYQGHGRGLPVADVAAVSAFAVDGVTATVVVLLDVPAGEAAARRSGTSADRLEREGGGFHGRVAEGFAALAAADPGRWVLVDGTGDPAEVAERVWAAVEPRL